MRWRLLGLFFFAVAGVVAWTFWARPEAETWLKGKIESVGSRRLGQDVRVESLSIHPLLFHLDMKGLRVGPSTDPLFTADRWTLHTAFGSESSPLSLFFLTFVRSDLDRPSLQIPPLSEGGIPLSEHWWRNLPRHQIKWTNGTVRFQAGSPLPRVTVSPSEGTLQFSPVGLLLNVRGDSSLGAFKMELAGNESLRPGPHFDVQFEGTLEKSPFEFFAPWLPASAGRLIGTGDISVKASIQDPRPGRDSLDRAEWSVGVRRIKGIWFPPGARPKDTGVPVEGGVEVRPGRLEFQGVRLFGALGLAGSVNPGPGGSVDLSWRGDKVLLLDLAESGFGFLQALPRRGTLVTEGTVSGPLSRPESRWTATLSDAGYPGLLWPDVRVEGRWKDDWLSLKTEGMMGQLEAAGTLPTPGQKANKPGGVWTLRATSLDLSLLARRNGWPRVRGLLNGSFSLVDAGGDGRFRPDAEGNLRIDDFAWGVHQETAPVQGRLFLDAKGLRVQGNGGSFDLDVRRSSGVWRVDHLSYSAGGLRVWGNGLLRDGEGNLQLEGGLQGLALADIPPLTKRFPLVEGRLSAEGRWHGPWSDPVFSGKIGVEGARWRPGGVAHRGEADLRGGRRGVAVARFLWDDRVRGEGAWIFDKGGKFSVDVDRARGEELFDFFVSSSPLEGVFSGKASLSSGDHPGLEGWVRFSGEEGRWKGVPFEETKGTAYFRGSRVELESVEVTQKGGSLRATGDAVRRPPRPSNPGAVWDWRLSVVSTNFAAGPAVLSGSWTARGFNRFREGTGAGELKGADLSLDGRSAGSGSFRAGPVSLGDLVAKFSWSPDRWRLDEFIMTLGVRAEAEVVKDGGSLTGRVQLKDIPLGRFFPSAVPSSLRWGKVSGEGVLSGSLPDPRGELSLTSSGAGWKEVSLEGDAGLIWNGHLEVPRFSLKFPGGGTFSLIGRWTPPGKEGPSSSQWEGRWEGVSLTPFFQAVAPVSSWTGTTEGAVSLQGPFPRMGGEVRMKGQAQGPETTPLSWQSRFQVEGATATVREAELTTSEGRWRLRPGSSVSMGDRGVWDFRLGNDLRNISLGPLQLFGGVSLNGQASFKEGTIRCLVGAESLWINQRVFDQKLAQVRLSREFVDFTPVAGATSYVQGRVRLDRWPQTFFENLTVWESGRRIFVLAGELGPGLWDFSLQGWGIQAETLLTLADFDWPISGPWNVRARGTGSLSAPEVEADVSGGPGLLGPVPYDRLEAQAHWVGQGVDVRGLRLSRRKGFLLTGGGRLPVRGDGTGFQEMEFDLHLTDGKLAVLSEFWPLCRSARGSFYGDLRVEPATPDPRVTGSFHLQDGRLSLKSYAPRVRHLNADVVLRNDQARVEHARARVGDGWIEMAGDIGIHGLSPVDYDLSVQSDGPRGVKVEVPQLSVAPGPLLGRFSFLSDKLKGISSGEPLVSLRVKGPHGLHVISGDALLENTQFTYPPTPGAGGIPGPRWWKNFWRQAGWDVHLKTGKETWYRNEYVNVRLNGALRLEGHPGAWALNGRVGSSEGAINYLGQTFQVKRGDFEVVTDPGSPLGGAKILPFVSGEAERVVTTVDARGLSTDDTISMVLDRALLGEIQPRFVSRNSPDLKSDRVAMKALGLTSEQQGSPADRDQLLRAGLVQLVGSSAAPLANRLAQKFGIGIISPIYEPPPAQEVAPTVAPAVPGAAVAPKAGPLREYLRGAGASARIRLTDQLSGVYKVKLDEGPHQAYFRDQIEIILRLRGSLYMHASTDLDSETLLGQPPERRYFLENQWRFGLPKRKKKEVPEPKK